MALGAWWVWWRLPKRQAERLELTDPKARADVEDNFRKTIGQLIGGAAVLAGAGFAYLQFQEQQNSARDLLITNQVAKGFELLGNKDDKIEQRLGGIYALEGVMHSSERYYRPVVEALCAFVRNETKADLGDEPPATDVQAALTVIARKPRRIISSRSPDVPIIGGFIHTNLAGAHIAKADLFGADLAFANLGGANLHGATLATADLTATSSPCRLT